VYIGYDLCHPGCPKIFFVHFDPCDPEKVGRQLLHPSDAPTMQIW